MIGGANGKYQTLDIQCIVGYGNEKFINLMAL
jgi:hypothetical protein